MIITTRHVGATAASVLLALSLAGCGKLAEEAIEQAVENESGEDVEIDFDAEDGTFSIEGENGEEFSIDVDENGEASTMSGTDEDGNTFELSSGRDIPDEWPDDIPTPPGPVTSGSVFTENGAHTVSVSTEVPDPTLAYEGYLEQLNSIGFTTESTSTFEGDGGGSSFGILARDDMSIQVSSLSDDTGSNMLIVVVIVPAG